MSFIQCLVFGHFPSLPSPTFPNTPQTRTHCRDREYSSASLHPPRRSSHLPMLPVFFWNFPSLARPLIQVLKRAEPMPISGRLHRLSSFFFYFSFFRDGVSLCYPGWSAVAQSQLTETSSSQVQVIPLPQPPEELGSQACPTMPG